MTYSADIQKPERHFLPEDFRITTWDNLEPFFKELAGRDIPSGKDLERWLRDSSELEAVISEDASWRQIRMTCDTENKPLEEAFVFFMTEIQPKIQPYADQLNRKFIACPFTAQLDQDKYFTYLRTIKKNIQLFREENIPLFSELSILGQHYGVISGKMTVSINGNEYTLQQASKFLKDQDRDFREEVYCKIQERRLQDKNQLNELYSTLVAKRNQVALNAGFENYRDYKFVELGRFDYTKEDCFQFHDAIKVHVLPLVNIINENQRQKLKLEKLRPWDGEAEPKGVEPLRPFQTGAELLEKSIACFRQLDPFFADCLETMRKMNRLDLESRKGKAPGGYNCPLAETGAPFIFMNAAGQMSDVTTMVHEGGHAVQSFLTHGLELNAFKDYPMEIAEVASMAMELFSMDYWNVFFDDPEELQRAKEYQLERVISVFPWIATIDKFQHWVYENPGHGPEQRKNKWTEIVAEYSSPVTDWSGIEEYRHFSWQRQLHLFEVPFYYIEYGIAQLGAIGMWMQFKQNKLEALENYVRALGLGGTKTLPELYRAAGLRFDFSGEHIKTLMDFVNQEMKRVFKKSA